MTSPHIFLFVKGGRRISCRLRDLLNRKIRRPKRSDADRIRIRKQRKKCLLCMSYVFCLLLSSLLLRMRVFCSSLACVAFVALATVSDDGWWLSLRHTTWTDSRAVGVASLFQDNRRTFCILIEICVGPSIRTSRLINFFAPMLIPPPACIWQQPGLDNKRQVGLLGAIDRSFDRRSSKDRS